MDVTALRLGLRRGGLGRFGGSSSKMLSSESLPGESLPGESLSGESDRGESAGVSVCGAESLLRKRAWTKAGRRLIARHVSRLADGSQSARAAPMRRAVDN
jgi:hypothetical protein